MLKTDLIIVLKATVVLICMWFMDNSDILELDFDYISRFQWRCEGTIDSVRTAQALVRRETPPRQCVAHLHLLIVWRLMSGDWREDLDLTCFALELN
ncbi:hypothetical protein CEXT_452311 [Caerostris extrusa]|uniref:Secreted protein n=1 Tax=Caerostris extrusa TaxID=172846 RepID=A0AAV4YBQ0_CAEEX|nr:hypothetical protein CEXT_452311 [Caerostris extrusa]